MVLLFWFLVIYFCVKYNGHRNNSAYKNTLVAMLLVVVATTMKKSHAWISIYCVLIKCVSPWCNHHGWLGVKKQFLFLSVPPEASPAGCKTDASHSSDSLRPHRSLQTGRCHWGKEDEEWPALFLFVCVFQDVHACMCVCVCVYVCVCMHGMVFPNKIMCFINLFIIINYTLRFWKLRWIG